MSTDPKESSFMIAAEKQIDRLIRANRWHRVLLAVVVVLVVLLGWVAWRQHQEAIDGCRAGNSYKQSDVQVWNYVLGISAQANAKKPGVAAKVKQVEDHIAQLDAPRKCPSTWNLLSEGSRP